MNNEKIYNHFEKQHSYTFATIDNGYPETRIAHFNTYDDDGLYFMTMKVKPFYKQLITSSKVSVCSLVSDNIASTHDDSGLPLFPPGYFIRVTGDVKELSYEELSLKAASNPNFIPLLKDIEKYPTMTTFVLHRFKGEIFDYDFEKSTRENKIIRKRFTFNNMPQEKAGFTIDKEKCIACGLCYKACSFKAIMPGEKYSINGNYCDECGSCYLVCPKDAIIPKTPMIKPC